MSSVDNGACLPGRLGPPFLWRSSQYVAQALHPHFSNLKAVFILPWFIVPGLQMKWKLKMGVYCTFLLGLINIIFCLVRFITIQTSQVNSRLPLSLVGESSCT